MPRNPDEYKPLKFYKDNSEKMENGFAKFSADGGHWFCRYVDGEIALISQSYRAPSGRDNGIESVKKNEGKRERYRFDTRDGGKHGFSLIAGNRQEIAVSPNFTSRTKAEAMAGKMSGTANASRSRRKTTTRKPAALRTPGKSGNAASDKTPAKSSAKAATDGRRGNYKPLAFYQTHGGGTQDGFDTFEHDGAYYFSHRQGGQVVLISEAYTSASGRDNGIKSVTKNLPNIARYKHRVHSNGRHYFDLVAGNNQEIATSVWYDSEAAAMSAAADLRGGKKKAAAKPKAAAKKAPAKKAPAKKAEPKSKAAPAAAAAAVAATGAAAAARANFRHEDGYQPLAFYEKNSTSREDGFDSFTDEDGEHFFVYRENGKIALISEGYPTKAARDNGIASVTKNMKLEDRYDYREGGIDGKPGFRLRAGNNQEIARSVAYGSAAAATAGAAYLLGTRKRAEPKPPAPKPAPKPSVAPIAAAGVAAAGLAAAGAAAAAPKKDPNRDKTDDYLACDEYEGHPVTIAEHRVAEFQHSNGLYYFAFYQPDGDVRWRSEGFETVAARQEELDIALRLYENGEHIKRMERGERYIDLLHDETGREVARSCLCTVAPVVAAPVAAAAAPVAAAAPAAVISEGGGLGWLKWVLLGLLGLLGIFLLSRCFGGDVDAPAVVAPTPEVAMVTCWNGTEARTQAACPARIVCDDGTAVTNRSDCPVVEVAPTPEPVMVTCWDGSTAETQARCPVRPSYECWDGSMALNRAACPARPAPVRTAALPATGIFDSCATGTRVTRLGTNPEFGDSRGLDAAGFKAKLDMRHATDNMDRNYLNFISRQLGYSTWNDVPSSAVTETSVPMGTKGVLGYGPNHAYQCAVLDVSDRSDLDAFQLVGANGRTIYYMKRCGNYFYPS